MAVVVCVPNGDENRDRPSGGGAEGARPGGTPAASPQPSPSLLEHSQNVVTDPDVQTYELAKCGCDCWYCPDCCERKGYNLRAELIPVLETFTGLMMLTLTIDPELFPSPRDAYLYVREKRGISRLMRELDRGGHLHSRRYFYVIECQRETEQVHYHVLVDATRIPKPAIDAAWSKLRPKDAGPPAPNRPAFGMTRFSVRKFEGGAEHAGRYATKYLVKTPEHGWPAWVMAMGREHRLPRYSASRGFWNRESVPSVPSGKTRDTQPRTYGDRVAECGTSCNVFESKEGIDTETGEVRMRLFWKARVGVGEDVLEIISPTGQKRPRATIRASGVRACVEAVQLAAGHPVAVLAGPGAERGPR